MRRSELELTNMEDKLEVLRKCEVIHIGFQNEPYPYIVPMNFGFDFNDGKLTIYLHCAQEGLKLKLMENSPKVGFQTEWYYSNPSEGLHCKISYGSLIGGGTLSRITDPDEFVAATNAMMRQYHKRPVKRYSEALYRGIHMLKLDVEEITGKQA